MDPWQDAPSTRQSSSYVESSLSLFHIAYIDQAYIRSPYFRWTVYLRRGRERDNVAGANITFSAASPLQRLLCDRAKVILRKRVCLHTRGRKSISTISVLTMDRLFSERACYFWDSGGGANYYSVWRPGCLLRGVGVADKIKYQRKREHATSCYFVSHLEIENVEVGLSSSKQIFGMTYEPIDYCSVTWILC